MKEKLCKHCQSPINSKDQRTVFCCRSCSATYLNKEIPKRKKSKVCKTCESLIFSYQTFCTDCKRQGKHLKRGMSITDMSLQEFESITPNAGAGKYSEIRYHAKVAAKNLSNICRCGYDKHVEVCHIRPISKFPKSTLIKEINAENNLIKLCPNCHWELDHGLLIL